MPINYLPNPRPTNPAAPRQFGAFGARPPQQGRPMLSGMRPPQGQPAPRPMAPRAPQPGGNPWSLAAQRPPAPRNPNMAGAGMMGAGMMMSDERSKKRIAELEDLNAGLAWLVERGVADPARAAGGGWSWGGYLTLMELGKHPELWVCGMAGIPVGDYELSYDDMSPDLQAYDRALLGGTPAEVPELMADRNAIYSADAVRVPVLFVIGQNDSRCPFRGAMAYVEKLAARNHPHEVYVFSTGHGSFDIEEEIRQQRAILDFLSRNVPGVTTP